MALVPPDFAHCRTRIITVEDIEAGPRDGSCKEQIPDFFTPGGENMTVGTMIVTGNAEAMLNTGSVKDLFTRLVVWRHIGVCRACRWCRQARLGLPNVVLEYVQLEGLRVCAFKFK